MFKRVLAVAAASSLAAASLYAAGCSSSPSPAEASDSGGDAETIHHAAEAAGEPPTDADSGGNTEASSDSDSGGNTEMCEPGSVSSVTFGLNPSAASAGMCTPALISEIVDNCLGGDPDAGTTTCNDLLQPNTPVYTCFYDCVTVDWTGSTSATNYLSTPWGGIINLPSSIPGGDFQSLNVGGCIVAAAGGNAAATACAADIEEDLECDLEACGANCPLPAETDPTYDEATSAFYNCFNVADPTSGTGGECSKYSTAINTDCSADSGPVAAAFNTCVGLAGNDGVINDPSSSLADYVQAWNQYLNLVCGPGTTTTPDGGP
jgi:hypothetical protein